MTIARISGIVVFSSCLLAQPAILPDVAVSRGLTPHPAPSSPMFAAPTRPDGNPFWDAFGGFDSEIAKRPISGVVSLRELQHPISKKAVREAYEAQQFARAHDFSGAIGKLESAIRIDPGYRDAHCNLGVLYARAGRADDALSELHRALEIGPPVATIYSNLALISAAVGRLPDAKMYADKTLDLDRSNVLARRILTALEEH